LSDEACRTDIRTTLSLDGTNRLDTPEKPNVPTVLPIDSLPIACVVWSPQLTVLSWNPASQRTFGYLSHEVIGRSLNELPLVPKAQRSGLADVLKRVMRNRLTLEREIEIMTRDGNSILCQWMNTALEASGRIVGALSMAQDVAERLHVVRELLLDGKRLERLLALTQSKPKTTEELLTNSLDEAIALTSSESGWIACYDEAAQRFSRRFHSKNAASPGEAVSLLAMERTETAGIWEKVVTLKEPFIDNAFSAPGGVPGILPLRGLLVVPLFVKEKIAAVVGVVNAPGGIPNPMQDSLRCSWTALGA